MDDDPYQVPQSQIVPAGGGDVGNLKTAVRHWERLRLVYNGILIPVGLLVSFPLIKVMGPAPYLIGGLMYTFGANVCYCLGPLVEVYLSVFSSVRVEGARMAMFIVGTVGSVLLTAFIGLGSWGLML